MKDKVRVGDCERKKTRERRVKENVNERMSEWISHRILGTVWDRKGRKESGTVIIEDSVRKEETQRRKMKIRMKEWVSDRM